jgi:hypothetical protein
MLSVYKLAARPYFATLANIEAILISIISLLSNRGNFTGAQQADHAMVVVVVFTIPCALLLFSLLLLLKPSSGRRSLLRSKLKL